MIAPETAPYSVQRVTKSYIDLRSPTSTPLELVQMLPSLNISLMDTAGMYGGGLSIRGLSDEDMALLLNGAATTPIAFFNEVSDPENLQTVMVTPDHAAIDLPSSTAAAGVMNVVQIDPSVKFSGLADFSYGTKALARAFLRLQTGIIPNTGLKSFFSFSHTHSHSWMGVGRAERKHVDFGVRQDWANGSFLKITTVWNNEQAAYDNFPNAEQFERYKHHGVGWGHSRDQGRQADGRDNDARANQLSWNQLFVSAPFHAVLGEKWRFDLKPYLSLGRGWISNGATGGSLTGAGGGTLVTQEGAPVPPGEALIAYFQADQKRTVGVVSEIIADWNAHNTLSFGYWYENKIAQYGRPSNLAAADGAALSPAFGDKKTYVSVGGKLYRNGTYNDVGYDINSFFLSNRSHYLHDRLNVLAGFKYILSAYWDNRISPGAAIRLGQNLTAPLPQLSVSYRINRHHQLFVLAQGDFRQPDPGNLVFVAGKLPNSQYSIKEELGYRFGDRNVTLEASFFNYSIVNRLQTTFFGADSYGTITIGSQTSRGVDALIASRAWHHASLYTSVEYLHATLDSNAPWGDSYLPTRNRQAPLAPHVLANLGLTYDDRHVFGNIGLHYAGSQSVTLVGDQRIPGYVVGNLSLGYRFPSRSYVKAPVFKLNIANLTGAIIRTGTQGLATNRKPVTLVNGRPGPKAGPGASFLTTPRFSLTGTFSLGF